MDDFKFGDRVFHKQTKQIGTCFGYSIEYATSVHVKWDDTNDVVTNPYYNPSDLEKCYVGENIFIKYTLN